MRLENASVAFSLLALTLLVGLAVPRPGWAADPVRLTVEADRLEVAPGETVELTVELRDAEDEPATAPRDLTIHLVLVRDDEAVGATDVTIAQGASNARHVVEAKDPGLMEVRAEHPELRNGGAFFHVRTGTGSTLRSATLSRPIHRVAPLPRPSSLRPDVTARRPEPGSAADAPEEGDASEEAEPEMAEAAGDPTAAPTGPPTADSPRLILRSSPRRGLLANGKDPATIYAFLQGGAPSGYRIHLVPDTGELDPLPLHIQSGRSSGTARLTATRPGRVKVEYVSADPRLEGVEPELLEVEFEPPITSLRVTAPDSLWVGDTGDLVARLTNDVSGEPIATATERQVTFDVTAGRIRLGAHVVTVPAGASEARTTVTGEWWGDAEILASTPNLLTQPISLTIEFPWALLAVAAAGSLAGGFIAWTYGKSKHQWLWQRLFSGLVTGLVFYWLLLLTQIVPSTAVAHPLGVFAVAVLGGWLGTEVFDLALDRLGLRTAQAPAEG